MMTEPKKSLGQHWLNDDQTLNAICDLADLKPSDTVLEIGPGQGSLTKKLVDKAGQVVAVEKDEALASTLAGSDPAKLGRLKVVQGDILKFDLTTMPKGYKVVANIPFYLTNNLLRVLCEGANPPSIMVLLVQKEVAERVAAKPGAMSLLSVSVQFYCEVNLGPVVPAKLFNPAPKVDSQVLKLTYHPKPLFPRTDLVQFFRVVKAGFANRRKTLLNSLSAGLQKPKTEVVEMLNQADIRPQARPQELSLAEWHNLYHHNLRT